MGPPHATPRKGNSESGIHIQTKVSPSQLPLDDRKLTQPQCDRSPNRANASNAPTPPLSRHQLRQPPPQHRPATPNGALNPCRLHPRLQTIHETRHIRHDVDPSRARFWHLRCFGCFGRLPMDALSRNSNHTKKRGGQASAQASKFIRKTIEVAVDSKRSPDERHLNPCEGKTWDGSNSS